MKFVPHQIPVPMMTADDYLKKACEEIQRVLQHHDDKPVLTVNESVQLAIKQEAASLNQKLKLKNLRILHLHQALSNQYTLRHFQGSRHNLHFTTNFQSSGNQEFNDTTIHHSIIKKFCDCRCLQYPMICQ